LKTTGSKFLVESAEAMPDKGLQVQSRPATCVASRNIRALADSQYMFTAGGGEARGTRPKTEDHHRQSRPERKALGEALLRIATGYAQNTDACHLKRGASVKSADRSTEFTALNINIAHDSELRQRSHLPAPQEIVPPATASDQKWQQT
jgi:hypothetical protein